MFACVRVLAVTSGEYLRRYSRRSMAFVTHAFKLKHIRIRIHPPRSALLIRHPTTKLASFLAGAMALAKKSKQSNDLIFDEFLARLAADGATIVLNPL